jgi:hypothetical protein
MFRRSVAFVIFTCAACSGATAPTPDANDALTPTLVEGGRCITSLDEATARVASCISRPLCTALYDDIHAPVDGGMYASFRMGTCGASLMFYGRCGFDSFVCVYDASTRALVGAAGSTDYPAYCDGGTSCIGGGSLPTEIQCATYGLTLACDLPPVGADASRVLDASDVAGG